MLTISAQAAAMDRRPRLSIEERSFLENSNVPEEYVADMRHRADWTTCRDELRSVGRFFAWGFRKCASGHRLTNGSGRCIQCNPATIAFVLRHARPGWLYIAAPEGTSLTKVGVAADVDARLSQLNAHRLAGVRCWRAAYVDWCNNPAALEAELHRRLADYRESAVYHRKGGQASRELFACDASTAIEALAEIYADNPVW